jgi:hypothetical protein
MANELDALMTLLELTSSSSLVALTRAIAKNTKLVDRVVLDEEDQRVTLHWKLGMKFARQYRLAKSGMTVP